MVPGEGDCAAPAALGAQRVADWSTVGSHCEPSAASKDFSFCGGARGDIAAGTLPAVGIVALGFKPADHC